MGLKELSVWHLIEDVNDNYKVLDCDINESIFRQRYGKLHEVTNWKSATRSTSNSRAYREIYGPCPADMYSIGWSYVIHPSFSSTACVRGGINSSRLLSEADWASIVFPECFNRKASTIFDLSCSATLICKVTGQLLKAITGEWLSAAGPSLKKPKEKPYVLGGNQERSEYPPSNANYRFQYPVLPWVPKLVT